MGDGIVGVDMRNYNFECKFLSNAIKDCEEHLDSFILVYIA